jgi:hypothetical protein
MNFWSLGYMMTFWSRVENKLEANDLSSKKIEQERVAVINVRVNEKRSNG